MAGRVIRCGVQAILTEVWPEMLKTISSRPTKLSPLTKAMRASGPRVAAWRSLDLLHAAAAPGSGRAPRMLSSGEASMTDRAILRVLVDAGAVASSTELDARLVGAALSVGITLDSVVPPGSRIEPVSYIHEVFPGSRVLAPGEEKEPRVAASLVPCSGPSTWELGRIPSSRGLYVSKSMYTALADSMVSRCMQLLQDARAVADAEEVESGDGNDASEDDASEGDGEDSMDVDSDGEGNVGGTDGQIDEAPKPAEEVGRAGPGNAPASAGAGSGFYSCESSQERPRDEAGGVGMQPMNEVRDEPVLQPRVFNTGGSNMMRKQGKIHKFFGSAGGHNSTGGGRAKSLHCVTPADGQDKENLTASPRAMEFA